MQDRISLLRLQRKFCWNEEGWFPPLADALQGVGPAEAAWQPPGGGNTIWQTVNHLNYYNQRMISEILGEASGPSLLDNDATFGAPGDLADAAGWQAALERTHQIAESLRELLAELSDADLERPFRSGTLGGRLATWLPHDAYHTGQIVLIRKQQGSWPAQR